MSANLNINTPDGSFSCYVAHPSGAGPHPVIVVLQEIFGVNAGIRSIADDYAAKGYIAVAPDLFWRAEPQLSMSEASEGDWAKASPSTAPTTSARACRTSQPPSPPPAPCPDRTARSA
jgi:carboxymethylenebutenolidase